MGPAVDNHTAQVYQEFGLRKRKSVNYDNPWPVDILGRIRPVQKHTADERNKQRKEKEKKSENPDLASESAKKAFSTYDVDTSFKLDKTDTNSLRDNAISPCSCDIFLLVLATTTNKEKLEISTDNWRT